MLRVALRRSTQTGILRTINNSRQRNAASASERTRDATADTRAQENHQQNITSNVQVDLPPPPKKVPIKIPSLYAYFSSSAKERQFFHDQWRLENPPPERGPPDIDVLAQNLMVRPHLFTQIFLPLVTLLRCYGSRWGQMSNFVRSTMSLREIDLGIVKLLCMCTNS